MKKISAILLALIMMLSMVASAGTIKVESTNTNGDTNTVEETYTAYKILDADASGKVYTIAANDEAWLPKLQAAGQTWLTLTLSADKTVYVVTLKDTITTEEQKNAAALALAEYLNSNKPAGVTGESLIVGNNEVDDGYYLITTSKGSALVLDTFQSATVEVKNEYPSVSKEVAPTNATIGATVTYTLTVIVPETVDSAITIYDTMEAGLTFIADGEDTDIECDSHANGVTIWTVPADKAGETLTLTYTAYINTASGDIIGDTLETANGKTDTNDNEVYLKYSNYTSTTDDAKVSTYMATFLKVNEDDEALKNVTFKLVAKDGTAIEVVKTESGAFRVADKATKEATGYKAETITTDEKGEIKIEGLGNGEYQLVELTTNEGYNLLTKPVDFKIENANNEYNNVEGESNDNNVIINRAGSALPSTGGIGTTIFYTVGGLMMAAAIVLLVAKKKVAASK